MYSTGCMTVYESPDVIIPVSSEPEIRPFQVD
jgi:hypothetical protein